MPERAKLQKQYARKHIPPGELDQLLSVLNGDRIVVASCYDTPDRSTGCRRILKELRDLTLLALVEAQRPDVSAAETAWCRTAFSELSRLVQRGDEAMFQADAVFRSDRFDPDTVVYRDLVFDPGAVGSHRATADAIRAVVDRYKAGEQPDERLLDAIDQPEHIGSETAEERIVRQEIASRARIDLWSYLADDTYAAWQCFARCSFDECRRYFFVKHGTTTHCSKRCRVRGENRRRSSRLEIPAL